MLKFGSRSEIVPGERYLHYLKNLQRLDNALKAGQVPFSAKLSIDLTSQADYVGFLPGVG